MNQMIIPQPEINAENFENIGHFHKRWVIIYTAPPPKIWHKSPLLHKRFEKVYTFEISFKNQ